MVTVTHSVMLSSTCIDDYIYPLFAYVVTVVCVLYLRTALSLGYYTASMGNLLPTFQDKLSVPSSRKNCLKMGSIGCPKMLVRNYPYSLHNNSEECSFYLLGGGSLKSCMCYTCLLWCTGKWPSTLSLLDEVWDPLQFIFVFCVNWNQLVQFCLMDN